MRDFAPGEGPGVVLVKLGGSLITEKAGDAEARGEVIERLAGEIAAGADATGERIVLGHGSGSFGHPPAAEHGLREGAATEEERRALSRTQDRAARLHRRVVAALRDRGLPTFSLVPSSAAVADDGKLVALAAEPALRAVEQGYLPVTYGDVVVDRRRGVTIASTESVILRLAEALVEVGWPVRRAIWLGTTPGVYGPEGDVIPRIRSGEGVPEAVGGSGDTDVTGGMRHRVETALRLTGTGVSSWIGDGRRSGALERALAGEQEGGTLVPVAG